jgi:hypothetical protein
MEMERDLCPSLTFVSTLLFLNDEAPSPENPESNGHGGLVDCSFFNRADAETPPALFSNSGPNRDSVDSPAYRNIALPSRVYDKNETNKHILLALPHSTH